MADYSEVGYQVISASSVIGDSGKPIAIYSYSFKSDGTAGVITFRNGTTASGTAIWDDTGTINVTKVVPLAVGIVLPAGLFVSLDAHATTATIAYRQILS